MRVADDAENLSICHESLNQPEPVIDTYIIQDVIDKVVYYIILSHPWYSFGDHGCVVSRGYFFYIDETFVPDESKVVAVQITPAQPGYRLLRRGIDRRDEQQSSHIGQVTITLHRKDDDISHTLQFGLVHSLHSANIACTGKAAVRMAQDT
jgi:hypothetical protein